jgi:endonuclease/exonuclease/phosphatase family metal-dependent hydrolase
METTIRVLSYNIHKGFASLRPHFILERIRTAIREVSADVIFLQEVIERHSTYHSSIEEWPSESQFEFLADEYWHHYAYGKNAVYPEGNHGNALLSTFPIIAYHNEDISTNRFEQRGILHAVIEIPETLMRVHCFNVHFDLSHRGRVLQVERLCALIQARTNTTDVLIIAGDFNDWPGRLSQIIADKIGAEEVFLAQHGRHSATFPSRFPILKLDRIYARGVVVDEVQAMHGHPWTELSDHCPLYATLRLVK